MRESEESERRVHRIGMSIELGWAGYIEFFFPHQSGLGLSPTCL